MFWMKFGIGDVHIIPLGSVDRYENGCCKLTLYLRPKVNFRHFFCMFRPILIKFGGKDLHKNLLCNLELCENWRSENQT
jgi:hypothetical protein